MFTIIDNKVYLIENDKMFPVNVSIENGVQKVGRAQDLAKGYQVYTLNEIQVKFNIKLEKPYYFDKEKHETELTKAEAEKEAEERAKMAEEETEKKSKEEADKKAKEEVQRGQSKPNGNKAEGDKPNN